MTPTHNIGISLGKIKGWNDGLGEFSRQFCLRISEIAPRWEEEFGIKFFLHLPRNFDGHFGPNVGYLPTCRLQKYFHWTRLNFSVWHSLHQGVRFLPPIGTGHHIQTIHDLNFLYDPKSARKNIYLRRRQRLVNRSDSIFAISHHVKSDIANHLQCRTEPAVIYNGVSDLTSVPRQPVRDLHNEDFFLHISRMAPSKGIFYLLDLAASWPEKKFVFAGGANASTKNVERIISERCISNITLLTDVTNEEKAWLYANCSAFIFPSLTEGFGLPPIEAMCFGKPVFLSNRTCLPEIGKDFAYYFDELSAPSMRRVIAHGLQNPHDSAMVQAHGRSYSWDLCVKSYAEQYLKILGMSDQKTGI